MKRVFYTFVVVAAITLIAGCGSKNIPKPEPVELIETNYSTATGENVGTSGEAQGSSESVETPSSVSAAEVIFSTDGIKNSSNFESYWDHDNDSFDMEHYLESTNPDNMTLPTEDMHAFTAIYGEDKYWKISITGTKLYVVDEKKSIYFIFVPTSYVDTVHIADYETHWIWLDNNHYTNIEENCLRVIERLVQLILKYPQDANAIEKELNNLQNDFKEHDISYSVVRQ